MLTSNITDVEPMDILTNGVTVSSDVSSEKSEIDRSLVNVPEMLTVPAFVATPSTSVAEAGRATIRFVCSLSRTAMVLLPSVQFSTWAVSTTGCVPSISVSSWIVTSNDAWDCPANTVTVPGTVASDGSPDARATTTLVATVELMVTCPVTTPTLSAALAGSTTPSVAVSLSCTAILSLPGA